MTSSSRGEKTRKPWKREEKIAAAGFVVSVVALPLMFLASVWSSGAQPIASLTSSHAPGIPLNETRILSVEILNADGTPPNPSYRFDCQFLEYEGGPLLASVASVDNICPWESNVTNPFIEARKRPGPKSMDQEFWGGSRWEDLEAGAFPRRAPHHSEDDPIRPSTDVASPGSNVSFSFHIYSGEPTLAKVNVTCILHDAHGSVRLITIVPIEIFSDDQEPVVCVFALPSDKTDYHLTLDYVVETDYGKDEPDYVPTDGFQTPFGVKVR